jgi:hypothetical protein
MKDIESFVKEFDELIALLKKMRMMADKGQLQEIDIEFINQCDILLDNYELIKSTLNPDLIEVVGNPIFEMVQDFVTMLKQELLNVYRLNNGNPELDEMHELDAMLNKPNLSVEDIDAILDKRIELMDKLKT